MNKENGGKCVATSSVSPIENLPSSLDGGGSALWVSYDTVKNCAKQNTLKILFKAIKWKIIASKAGRGSISQEECPDWKVLVEYGFARDGKANIHLNSLNIEGIAVRFDEAMLADDPKMVVANIIQTFFLRPLGLGGRTKATRMRHRRLVSNPDSGGMCLEYLAAAFNRTISWASKMRKRLVKAGYCIYDRRFSWASKIEGDLAKIIGLGDRYIDVKKAQKYLKERVSLCTQLMPVEFKIPYKGKFAKNDLETYAARKGRVAV